MTKLAVLVGALILAACDSPAEPDDRWEDPEAIQFPAELNVDLAQMTETPTGLYWQDVTVGLGAAAGVADTVWVHYTGWLPDGTVFDSSEDQSPLKFLLGVGLVIRGWDEGIVGMQVGGKRKLVIRPTLAYGRTGKGPIPPLTTLVFDVQLMNVRP
jgi:peptidylprolyl isomerase